MKLFDYQTYYIATDANHVTQHRRVVTPWFYVRLKTIRYVRVENAIRTYICSLFCVTGEYSGWEYDDNKYYKDILKEKLKQKLDIVTMVFNKAE